MSALPINTPAAHPVLVHKSEFVCLPTAELREILELDIAFAFAWSPEDLRDLAFERYATAELLSDLLSAAVKEADDLELYMCAGFRTPMTDRAWFNKMAAIAEGARRSRKVEDPDEIGYVDPAVKEAERLARATAALAAREAAKGVTPVQIPDAPHERAVVAAQWEKLSDEDFDLEEDELVEERGEENVGNRAADVTTLPSGEERELYLPVHKPGFMHLPNILLGSSIVRVGSPNKKRERWMEDAPKVISQVSGYKQGKIEISYSGEALYPGDIELWSKLLAAAAHRPLGSNVHIAKRELVTSIHGLRAGTSSYKSTRDAVVRLQAAIMQIRARDEAFIKQMTELFPDDPSVTNAKKAGFVEIRVQLLGASTTNGATWTIEVPRTLRTLFGKNLSSWFDETMYYSLKTDVARRLYLLYSSHVNCWPLRLAELREYTGSGYAQDSKFRERMDEAHAELKAAGAIKNWKFEQSYRRLDTLCYVVDRKVKPRKKIPTKPVARATATSEAPEAATV
ncbi:plasmid replication initiator TrfA [Burkholderia vietnamiensis]|uniref:plasmid replication initiator TrfA n=1 Tax=Burkholderia vietnamiensis TaxID=60552 RepID=UPI0026525CD1|nr:plasmid replication initiator TrfA [Burkholderia vietnamiensis]MDN7408013.1 plasmid replication initiator TrfA [Burkholderia vietnamiensis]